VEEYIEKQWKNNLYEYGNFSDFLRKAINKYKENKLSLKQYKKEGTIKNTVVMFNNEEMEFLNSFPRGRKYQIINSLLKTLN
jgi:hypothetical protein